MTRIEHLQWCKDRAMEYVHCDKLEQAFSSFCSDMKKHDETANHSGLKLGFMLFFNGHLSSAAEMKKWILGFS